MIIVNRTARILLAAVVLILAATLQPAGAAAAATGFAAPDRSAPAATRPSTVPGAQPRAARTKPVPLSHRLAGPLAKSALDPTTAQVAMRVLVIATNSDDWGIDTWKAVLDRTGTPYDVLTAQGTTLTTASLIRADSVGRYEAILLTN